MLYKNRNDPLLDALKAALGKLGWSDEQGGYVMLSAMDDERLRDMVTSSMA
jgi:hypothetical protein